MTTPLLTTSIELGGVARPIRFTMAAHRLAKRRLGRPIKEAVIDLQSLDIDVLCELAAAGMTEGQPKGSKGVITPEAVAGWLEVEPTKVPRLVVAVSGALTSSFERMFEGEASAVVASVAAAAATSTTKSESVDEPSADGPTSDG